MSGPGALQLLAASTERSIAIVLMAIVVVGWAIYVFVNIRQAQAEVGSEIELAPNRGRMPDDEELEGRRLEKVQAFGVLMLLIMALVLPIYWMLEGGRRSGAVTSFSEAAVSRGEVVAAAAACTDCHGADLGGARFAPVVLDIGHQFSDKDSFNINTTWEAPSLDDVFTRFDTDAETLDEVSEVRQIIVYGRGVMPAWGLEGGGPYNDQQIDDLVAWLWDARIGKEDEADDEDDDEINEAANARVTARFEAARASEEYEGASDGKILFDLHCARCHTPRWPGRGPAQLPNNGGTVMVEPGPAGAGRYGPALNGVSLERLFPDIEEHVSFISDGAADNVPYGEFARLGNYGMPGFKKVLDEEDIRKIVEYERSLDPESQTAVGFDLLHEAGDDE
ncbi:c-type cytochrome [Candidatus Poriferisodalis sp.]|uniref:c-type cytochrome n=1 Tax=Candidatus Poriferisodalis sp. TaxID=3101277 RepID=UPI003AF5EDA3